jgi:hypothetical protein
MSEGDKGGSNEVRQHRNAEKRAEFRRKHHYFPYLKYWETYEHKFDYLDNKSQGLLSISGILSAVFLLQFTVISDMSWRGLEGFVSILCFGSSAFGLLFVIRAQFVLLRCLSTTADSNFPTHSNEARKIEARVNAQSQGQSTDRNRVLESNLDIFLSLHRSMIQQIGTEHRKRETELQEIWHQIRKSESDEFKSFETSVSEFFGELRDTIEREVDERHLAYARARVCVENSLYALLLSVASFLVITILEKV